MGKRKWKFEYMAMTILTIWNSPLAGDSSNSLSVQLVQEVNLDKTRKVGRSYICVFWENKVDSDPWFWFLKFIFLTKLTLLVKEEALNKVRQSKTLVLEKAFKWEAENFFKTNTSRNSKPKTSWSMSSWPVPKWPTNISYFPAQGTKQQIYIVISKCTMQQIFNSPLSVTTLP